MGSAMASSDKLKCSPVRYLLQTLRGEVTCKRFAKEELLTEVGEGVGEAGQGRSRGEARVKSQAKSIIFLVYSSTVIKPFVHKNSLTAK